MRIFLLPISTRQALIYCQKSARQSTAPPSLADRITKKATETWAKWEDADRGWQKTIVKYGNAGLQRIPFQEWGLKSFPPAKAKLQAEYLANNRKFDVYFPGNVMRREDVPKTLLRMAKERKQLHWQRFIGSMVAMPITIPFALIPVYEGAPTLLSSFCAHKQ
jgi:Mitochondrial K+-H+ exchange-related